MRRWGLPIRRGGTARTLAGLPVPAAIRVVTERKLRALVDAAEADRLGWDANGLIPNAKDAYLILPYGYEEHRVAIWKCRVVVFVDGFSTDPGRLKKIKYGRLDVSLADFRRLPVASRKVERQLLHWLAWTAASAHWKKTAVIDGGA